MKTVLVADDDVITRKVLKRVCETLGYRVVEKEDGQKAWKEFQRKPMNILISDWMMPHMDGVSLCEKVKTKRGKRPYFFLITGKKKGWKNFEEAKNAGADDIIYKPVDYYVFKNQLERAEAVLAGENPGQEPDEDGPIEGAL